MQEISSSNNRYADYLRMRILLLLLTISITIPLHADIVEDVFNRDRNLLAATRYNSLSKTDAAAQTLLTNINPQTPTTNPLLDLLASNILVENITANIAAEEWAEALYFSQPLEKNNDWVYIFHVKSPEGYIGALLATGNIRQEQTEDDITRYRRTDGLDSDVYYLTYGANNLALMSKNFAAITKAVKLYQDKDSATNGIMPQTSSDYTLLLHLNRYFQVNSRILPNLLSMIHYDLLRDLAGTTAKSDNILNLILNYLESTLKSLINEIAIIHFQANLQNDSIDLNTEMLIQYGGSLHYALSAYEKNSTPLRSFLPPDSVVLNNIRLWPEEYIQLLEGIGNLATSLNPKATDRETLKQAENILTLFQKADPIAIQQGVIAPQSNTSRSGPVAVSVITFSDSSVLSNLFTESRNILTTGEYSEFLAEKGIKLEIHNTPAGQSSQHTAINETTMLLRSTYFTLPDVFLARQYILSTLVNNNMITVVPLAPLTEDQYNNTRDFCLQVLNTTAATSRNSSNAPESLLLSTAQEHQKENTILNLTFNPLRYLQIIMQSEAVWPTPSPPNRLPIPWREFAQFFNSKEATTPPLNLTVNSNRTSLSFKLILPATTLTSLMQALLNLTPRRRVLNAQPILLPVYPTSRSHPGTCTICCRRDAEFVCC